LDLPEAHKFVLLALQITPTTKVFVIPQSTHRLKCGFSVRQVQRIAAILREMGLLSRSKHGGGRRKTTLYKVSPEKGDKLSPFMRRRVTVRTSKGDIRDGKG